MNRAFKSKSTTSHWVLCVTLALTVFTFSGFTSSPKTNQRCATQTEQTVSVRQVNKRTVLFDRLMSTPFTVSDCKSLFSLLQFNRGIKNKLESNANLLLTFQKSDLVYRTHRTPSNPEEPVTIG